MVEQGDLGYPKPSLRTMDGLADAFEMIRRRIASGLAPVFLDLVFVGLLWMMVSYTASWFAWEKIRYFLVPGWVYAVCLVEVVALWESFARSLGTKIAGKQLARQDFGAPTFRQRVSYYLLWHVSVLPVVPLAFRRPPHERGSGLILRPILRGGEKPAPWYHTTAGLIIAALMLVIVVSSFALTIAPGTWESFLTRAGSAGKIFFSLFRPDSSLWLNGISKLFETIFMAIMATLFAVVVSVPLSFFAARNLSRNPIGRLVYTIIRGTLSILRSVQPIIWAILFLVWVGAQHAPFAGFLALFVHSVADLTKLYAERLESIDNGPLEAITATGGGWLAVLRYAVIPQIINPYISFTLYRWDINIRMATILGLVGAGGIGQPLIRYLQGQRFPQAAVYIYLITILVWAIDALSSRLRTYFEQGHIAEGNAQTVNAVDSEIATRS